MPFALKLAILIEESIFFLIKDICLKFSYLLFREDPGVEQIKP
jgi:hypothetical protein